MDCFISDAKEEKGIEEYAELSKALPPPGSRRAALTEGSKPKQSIAELKRKALEEREEEGGGRRVKLLNYSSEDSSLTRSQRELRTYYCAVCGAHCLITEVDLSELPQRTTDGAYALEEAVFFHKKYIGPGERTLLRRTSGVEIIFKIKCLECGMPVGYRLGPIHEHSKHTYFYTDALVDEQSNASVYTGVA